MIRVHPYVYRALWILVLALGAFLVTPVVILMPILILGEIPDRDLLLMNVGMGLLGAGLIIYALRRLINPLKAPPRAE